MPTQRLSMRRIKQLLTMRFGAGASTREIARELAVAVPCPNASPVQDVGNLAIAVAVKQAINLSDKFGLERNRCERGTRYQA